MDATREARRPNRCEVLESKTLGFRTELAADWARDAYLSAEYWGGKVGYFTVEVVCSGINDSWKRFATRTAAQAWFDSLGPGVEIRAPRTVEEMIIANERGRPLHRRIGGILPDEASTAGSRTIAAIFGRGKQTAAGRINRLRGIVDGPTRLA